MTNSIEEMLSPVHMIIVSKLIDEMHIFTETKIQLIQKITNIQLTSNQQFALKLSITRLTVKGRFTATNFLAEIEQEQLLTEFLLFLRGVRKLTQRSQDRSV